IAPLGLPVDLVTLLRGEFLFGVPTFSRVQARHLRTPDRVEGRTDELQPVLSARHAFQYVRRQAGLRAAASDGSKKRVIFRRNSSGMGTGRKSFCVTQTRT